MANATGPYYDIGLYVGVVQSQAVTKASTGTPQFTMRVKILGYPEGNTYVPVDKQYERTIYMAITEKTVPFVTETLKAMDYKGSSFSQLDPGHPNHVSFVGEQVTLWCGHKPDAQGNLRESWMVSKPREIEALPDRELRKLDALFGKALKSTSPAKVATPARNDADDGFIRDEDIPSNMLEDGLEITDDDIPF